ncbi:MAG: hypothetical protein BWY83_00127 [bacterium ADurb.Bin478]|nr:MAG: hypothetical protein BWY83_00127 [bacterium ADurb.Bin478]
MAMEMTGIGKFIFSRIIGCFRSQSVSPVRVERSPTAAAISPALTWLISSRLFADISRILLRRSFFSVEVLSTVAPLSIRPE